MINDLPIFLKIIVLFFSAIAVIGFVVTAMFALEEFFKFLG